MRLPKSKNILGTEIKYEFADLNDYDGIYDPIKKTISINKELKVNELALKTTILHEEGHAMFDILGLNQTSLSLDMQEIIVENFANFIIEHYKLTSRK